jgi:hypothetical protein
MNVGKVAAGGMLAGIVMFAFDFAQGNYLFAEDWQRLAQRHNFDPALMSGTDAIVTLAIADLVLGLVITLTYAAIRPRFGPGPGTGAVASFLVFAGIAAVLATFAPWFLPWDLYIRQGTVSLVAMLAAGFAGAWVYAETGDPG